MRNAYATITALCFPMLLLAACAREEPRPAPPSRPSARPAPRGVPPGPALSASAYMASASSIDLYEIRSSELALQRSSSARIREFATMMIQAHKGTSSQLSFAGRRLNLLPSAALNARHEALLTQLGSAADFDSVYRQQQRAVHQEALALHADYAARGTSPTLRPVAEAIRSVVERHIRLLRYL